MRYIVSYQPGKLFPDPGRHANFSDTMRKLGGKRFMPGTWLYESKHTISVPELFDLLKKHIDVSKDCLVVLQVHEPDGLATHGTILDTKVTLGDVLKSRPRRRTGRW